LARTDIANNTVTRQMRPKTRISPSPEIFQEMIDPVSAAGIIRARFAARAITSLSNSRTLDDGRVIPPRHSANDCYVALEESCLKMARVAVRKYNLERSLQAVGFSEALPTIFPEPVAYLIRAIRSVISDTEREIRREMPTVSFDAPLKGKGDGSFLLSDTLVDDHEETHPETALLETTDRVSFRNALTQALKMIPANYLTALERDMAREREREDGAKVSASSDKDRQTTCRARAALSEILKRECGLDNPFVRLIAQGRTGRVRRKTTQNTDWNDERQDALFRKLLQTPWSERPSDTATEAGDAEEAIVNEVGSRKAVASPTPEMRQALRVMDTYTLGDNPTAGVEEAQALYAQARKARYEQNDLTKAIQLYREAALTDPKFFAAKNEVGVLLSQTGNLRDALDVYLEIIENPSAGNARFIAATNAADIHLTWYDMGRNRERNIERALHFAQMAMQMPTPMRACNLLIAFVKDRYFVEAKQLMETVLQNNLPACPGEKFLQTLFQIRDADLVGWWNWLDEEIGKDA